MRAASVTSKVAVSALKHSPSGKAPDLGIVSLLSFTCGRSHVMRPPVVPLLSRWRHGWAPASAPARIITAPVKSVQATMWGNNSSIYLSTNSIYLSTN